MINKEYEVCMGKAASTIGFPAVIKTARGGYDGKGQWRVEDRAAARAAFLESRIPFPRIWETVAYAIHRHVAVAEPGLDDILEADREARAAAEGFVSTQ